MEISPSARFAASKKRVSHPEFQNFVSNLSFTPDDLDNNNGNVIINSKQNTNRKISDIVNISNICEGQECCDNITNKYDFTQGQCLPTTSGFTSMEQAYNNGEFTGDVLQNDNFMSTSSLIFSSYP
jgi:hypothetical protein